MYIAELVSALVPWLRVRRTAILVAGLSLIGASPSRLDVLTETLKKSDDLRVRFRAVQELGELGSPRAVPALIEALRPTRPDPRDDWFVRRAAVISLTRLGARGPLTEALDDPSPLVRAGCLEALARSAGGEAVSHLARSLARDPDEQVRLRALALLAATRGGQEAATAALRSAAETDESERVRERATLALRLARAAPGGGK